MGVRMTNEGQDGHHERPHRALKAKRAAPGNCLVLTLGPPPGCSRSTHS